jgi:hypothetical protein
MVKQKDVKQPGFPYFSGILRFALLVLRFALCYNFMVSNTL